MPFKFHEPHRHRVPKARYRVRNWAEYDRGLVQRGDVRVWISAEALAHWKAACRSTPGGQRRSSNLAVETVLVLGALYKLPLRQTEGCQIADRADAARADRARSYDAGAATTHHANHRVSLAAHKTRRHRHRQHRLEVPWRRRMGEGQAWRKPAILEEAAYFGEPRRQ